MPDILVFDYMGGGTIYALKVDTNVEGWTATGDADFYVQLVAADALLEEFSAK